MTIFVEQTAIRSGKFPPVLDEEESNPSIKDIECESLPSESTGYDSGFSEIIIADNSEGKIEDLDDQIVTEIMLLRQDMKQKEVFSL